MRRINIELNLTLACNQRCTNCNRHCDKYPDRTEHMTASQVARFLRQVARSSVQIKRLKVVGGEPLLNTHFPEVYNLLRVGLDEGLIQKVKVDSNRTVPWPNVAKDERIHRSGKRPSRKRHLPTLWSPRDMGHQTSGPCAMPRICGPSLDAYGYSPCSMAVMMLRVFRLEHLYRDEFPHGPWAMDEICPDCIFSMPTDWCEAHVYPLAETPEEALRPTPTWAKALAEFDGTAHKERW